MSPVALPSTTAAVLVGPRDIRMEDRVLWAPISASNHVQVKVVCTGLCGSDRTFAFYRSNSHPSVHA
jgi:L-iditol 2-dehydrogenase